MGLSMAFHREMMKQTVANERSPPLSERISVPPLPVFFLVDANWEVPSLPGGVTVRIKVFSSSLKSMPPFNLKQIENYINPTILKIMKEYFISFLSQRILE